MHGAGDSPGSPTRRGFIGRAVHVPQRRPALLQLMAIAGANLGTAHALNKLRWRGKHTAAPFVMYWDMPNPDAGAPGIISRLGHRGRLGAWGTYQSTRATEK